MNTDTTYLLVCHGSRGPDGNRETYEFATQWRARHPDWRIEVCFIEHADVLLEEGLDKAAQGSRQVIAIPFILNAAGHVKMEMPAALERARERHPTVEFRITRHLGMGREMLAILQEQLARQMKTMAVPDPQTTGIILLGRGSSDAGANGELAKMGRWIYEDNDHELVDLAFTGVTWPRLESVVQRHIKLGMMQLTILPVYLFTGVLMERIKEQVARLRQQYPQVVFALGTHFGFDEGVFKLLDLRITELEEGGGMLECDGCKYRALAEAEHLHDHSHTHTGGSCAHGGHDHGHQHAHGHESHGQGCAHAHNHSCLA